MIARLEHGLQGNNPRFIVTSLAGQKRRLYEQRYCARGEAENRIKQAQLDLFGRRASCHRFWANQLRLFCRSHRAQHTPSARHAGIEMALHHDYADEKRDAWRVLGTKLEEVLAAPGALP